MSPTSCALFLPSKHVIALVMMICCMYSISTSRRVILMMNPQQQQIVPSSKDAPSQQQQHEDHEDGPQRRPAANAFSSSTTTTTTTLQQKQQQQHESTPSNQEQEEKYAASTAIGTRPTMPSSVQLSSKSNHPSNASTPSNHHDESSSSSSINRLGELQQMHTTLVGNDNPRTITDVDHNNDDNNNSLLSSSSSSSCYALNSQSWLQGPRWNNVPVPDDWLDAMMQPHLLLQSHAMESILDQSICHATGRFRRATVHWNASDAALINDWQFKLLYLAIHRMHHQAAFPEYRLRLNNNKNCTTHEPSSSFDMEPPHNFDYECHNAKFLVTFLWPMGMGATVRNGAMPPLLAALALGRIPLFLQGIAEDPLNHSTNHTNSSNINSIKKKKSLANLTNITSIQEIMTRTFTLTSCDRHDLQCVLLPTSPCVLSHHDLRHATFVPERYARVLRRAARYDRPDLEQARVLVMDSRLVGFNDKWQVHEQFRQRAHGVILELIQDWKDHVDTSSSSNSRSSTAESATADIIEQQWQVFQAVADTFAAPFPQDRDGGFAGDNGKGVSALRNMRAALLYFIRPNAKARHGMHQQLSTTIMRQEQQKQSAAADAFTTTTASAVGPQAQTNELAPQYFGLPIRGSDKCIEESTCLSFDTYMSLMQFLQKRHGIPEKRPTILLTSEDESIIPMRIPYMQNASFNFSFVVNEQDRQPGGGRPERYEGQGDAVLISSLVAIQLQLQASVLVGNCCSNFHKLLFDFAAEGCGADPNIIYYCLNDMWDHPEFMICCGWYKGELCTQIRTDYQTSRLQHLRAQKKRLRLARLNRTLIQQ